MTASDTRDALADTALLDAYRGGNDAALSALLTRHAPSVLRFGMKMCRDPEDAKDVLQETLLAAARGARDFRGASALSTWLYTIARSFCIKKRRGGRVDTEPLDEESAMQLVSQVRPPDEVLAARELGAALEEAIEALTPPYREVLLLRDVEGLSALQVAEVLGVGVDAVKSRLHRARVAVRARMAPLLAPNVAPRGAECPDVVPMLSGYLEGEIDAKQCAQMDRHVATCERCRADCDSLRRVLALCKSEARAGTVPPDVQAAVQKALREIGARPRTSEHEDS